MRRIAAVIALLAGITLVGFTFAEHLVSRSSDAQTIAEHYQGLMSTRGLNDLQTGFNAVQAAGAQLGTQAEPRLQQELRLDDQQFADYMAREMPGIHQFDVTAPGVVKLVGPVIAQMRDARVDYARASGIPVSWLPLSSAPWLFLGIGTLLIATGALALVRPNTLTIGALLVVGLGVFVAPLVVSIPSKVDAAVRVTRVGRIGLAPATGKKAVAATALFDGMVSDVQTKLQPAMERAGVNFRTEYPTLARFATEWHDSTSAKSHDLSDSQVRLAPTFANADRIPLRPIAWLFILPGALLAVVAATALVAMRRAATRVTPAGAASVAPAAS